MATSRRSIVFAGLYGAIAGAAAARPLFDSALAKTRDENRPELPAGARSRFARINGIRLHYVEAGSGPTLILLHGWPQTWFAWRDVMPELAERFRVVAPDLRGTGLSERATDGYDKQTIAKDIRALIAHLGSEVAHVIGHDMGGKAAYVLAHIHPEAVSSLVLVDCLVPGTENADALKGGAWHYGFHMAPEIPEMLTKGRERAYIKAQIRAWSHRKSAISDETIAEYARHYAAAGGMTAGFNYYRTLREDARFVETLRGRRLAMPVMAIGGRYSVGDRLAAALRSQAANLTAVIADESGHFVPEEVPELFIKELNAFLPI